MTKEPTVKEINYERIELEEYLTVVKNFKQRNLLTKVRISNHDLEIEKEKYVGGYRKPEKRKCFHCQEFTEDERQFLLKCPL